MIVTVEGRELTSPELSVQQLREASYAIEREVAAREVLATAEQAVDGLARSYLSARDRDHQAGGDGQDPAAWTAPTGAHDAYPQGWVVTHGGTRWESLVPANVWEPGVSGWREVTSGGVAAKWVKPTGAHDAYSTGDEVLFQGQVWESVIDGNTWSPLEYPLGWRLVAPSSVATRGRS